MLNPVHVAVRSLLSERHLHPVLIDVGASGPTPPVWDPIAPLSCYIGFDPDSREMAEINDGQFHRTTIVNEAVTCEADASTAIFYLTRSPFCSSTLPPDATGLSNYIFSDLFEIEREVEVRATTLNAVIERLRLTCVDWLKLDTQGTDLRLYKSLSDETRSHVLAVDAEPGLIDAYQGEDLFVETHATFVREGFWLSDILVKGAIRMGRTTLGEALKRQPMLDENTLTNTLKPAPGWCEARYLRSLESLARNNAGERDYLLLWAFALIDGQTGFAYEVGLEFERRFPRDCHAQRLAAEAGHLMHLQCMKPPFAARLKTFVPGPLKRVLKRVIQ